MYNSIIFIILLASLVSSTNLSSKLIFAHNFDTDDNSSFLTLVNKILVENRLLNDSILHNQNNINISNSFEYVQNIENILEDILISEDSFIVDSDQFYNNTIIALVVANLADEVLRKYGSAFGVQSNIMLSMNFSNIINMQNRLDNTTNLNISINHTMTHHEKDTSHILNLIDKSSYFNALELSKRMIEIYNQELKGFSSNSSYVNNAISNLGDALDDLKKNIETEKSPYKIMEIVHGRVHPNLQMGFDLIIKR